MTPRLYLICLTLAAGLHGAQDFDHLQIEEIATGFAGGEGPVWSREGFLLFSDYEADRIYKYTPGQKPGGVPRSLERSQREYDGPAGPPLYLRVQIPSRDANRSRGESRNAGRSV